MITATWVSFQNLSPKALYDMLQLRVAVFMVEQNCLYQELDNKDQDATHLLIYDNEMLSAYARVLYDLEKKALSFGRLVTATSQRGKGLGKMMMDEIMLYFKEHQPRQPITISAQCYLENFYQHYGFISQGKPYKEDNLPHILMVHDGVQ
jgi:ElaA protein